MASVGAILGGAFGLIRRRPGAVVGWALIYVVGNFLIGGLRMGMTFGAMRTPRPGDLPPPAQMGLVAGITTQLLALALLAVLMTAVFRAVLRPQEQRAASLRLGMDEVRVFVLTLLVTLAFVVAMFVLVLLDGLIVSALSVVIASPGALIAIQFGLALGLIAALIFFQVRLSIAFPLTYYRGRLTVDEAWDLTRGHFWTIFAAQLAVVALLVLGWLALLLAFFGDLLLAVARAHGDPNAIGLGGVQMAVRVTHMPPMLQVLFIVAILTFLALGFALATGVQASAARELLDDAGEPFEKGVEPF
ncbi:hypothetical protein ACG3SL_17185 [Sphingomonas sp. CJ20]